MGVRGLETYLEKFCKDGCVEVSIPQLIKQRRKDVEDRPVIIVDGYSCLFLWYKDLDRLAGVQTTEFIARLRNFVDAFENEGAKLIFFFDGNVVNKKRPTWGKRQLAENVKIADILNSMRKGYSLNDALRAHDRFNIFPAHLGLHSQSLIKYVIKAEAYRTLRECDEEIIQYARAHNAFAILGQDSDFVISNTGAIYLSAKHLNLTTMTTKTYSAAALANSLSLDVEDLPIFATLSGNDYINFDNHLKFLHETKIFDIRIESRFLQKAEFVRGAKKRRLSYAQMAIEWFNDPSMCSSIIQSVESYSTKIIRDIEFGNSPWEELLRICKEKHRRIEIPPALWGVMSAQTYEMGVCMQNLQLSRESAVYVTRPLRKRIYALLLKEHPEKRLVVNEWVSESMTSAQRPTLIHVWMDDAILASPSLRELWSDDKSSEIMEKRWSMFSHLIGFDTSKIAEWMKLPHSLILPAAAISFMRKEKIVDDLEAKVLLSSTVTSYLYHLQNKTMPDSRLQQYPNLRAVHVAVTFCRTIWNCFEALAACGYPIPLSAELVSIPFDNKMIQENYKKMHDAIDILDIAISYATDAAPLFKIVDELTKC